jgi:hypothetical protein
MEQVLHGYSDQRDLPQRPNGDRWLLAYDADTDQVFVRHEPNLSSGGEVANIDIGAFLIAPGSGPEKQELPRATRPFTDRKLVATRASSVSRNR